MSIKEIDNLLLRFISEVELFKNIDLVDVAALLRQTTRIDVAQDELVFEEGSQGYSMYIVTQGAFEVYRAGVSLGVATLAMPGAHNRANALAAR